MEGLGPLVWEEIETKQTVVKGLVKLLYRCILFQVASGKLLLKIVKMKRRKTVITKFGPRLVQPVIVKDLANSKNQLSLWAPHCDAVSLNQVFIFSKIITEDYPKMKPFYLATTKESKFNKAPEHLAKLFDAIGFDDGTIFGCVTGFQNCFTYNSCGVCRRRIKVDVKTGKIPKNCKTCGKEINKENTINDFMFILCVMVDEELQYFTGFKNILKMEVINVESTDIEKELNDKFLDKMATLAFDKRKDENDVDNFIIISVDFTEN
jgi:hypothetical protein